jgi:phosphoglycolate phosphatase
MNVSAVIFDLDGTLLDTLADLAETTNAVLTGFGFPSFPLEDYKFLVGDGVRVLFQRAIPAESLDSPDSEKVLDKCVEAFNVEYATRWDRTSGLYPGIAEMLDELTLRRIPMGILSNKPQAFTEHCVRKLLGDWSFFPVFGQREGVPRKPDPAGVAETLQHWNLAPTQCLYVGDTNTDMQTGRSAGCVTIGVTWGFRPQSELLDAGAHYIIERPSELLKFM